MMPKVAKIYPMIHPKVPPLRMLYPAYSAIEPMIKSMMPQMSRIGMTSSISRRLCTQVLLANSEIASRMWKPPSTNIIIAAYVSKPGRLIVGVLSLLCPTISFLSPAPALAHGCPFRAAVNGAGIAYIGLASPLCRGCRSTEIEYQTWSALASNICLGYGFLPGHGSPALPDLTCWLLCGLLIFSGKDTVGLASWLLDPHVKDDPGVDLPLLDFLYGLVDLLQVQPGPNDRADHVDTVQYRLEDR